MSGKRRTSAEIIAFHFGSDIRDIQAARYQPSRYASPALYAIGDHYYCSPTYRQSPPSGWKWTEIGEHYGRKVYRADTNNDASSAP
jgi:hypothetical protein